MTNFRFKSAFAILALLSGCSVGPDYIEPQLELPSAFSAPESSQDISGKIAWWRSFEDAQLIGLVERALSGNKDIKRAVARVAEARASSREGFLNLFPTFTPKIGYDKTYISASESEDQGNRPRSNETYSAGFDAVWELDLFGRLRRGVELKDALAEMVDFEMFDAQRLVIAEAARNYFALQGTKHELDVARQNVANLQEIAKLIDFRVTAGQSSALEAAQARAQYNSAASNIPGLEAQVTNYIHALGVLIGRPPTALVEELSSVQSLPQYKGPNTIGNPSTLLRRRPDIKAAERNLAAQTAGIGVAVGDLFPRINFAGNLGASASDWSALNDANAHTYRIGPSISWPGFSLGVVFSRIRGADARAIQALASYEATVLGALKEVEDSLALYSSEMARHDLLTLAAENSRMAANLARKQYEQGATDFLTLLDTERSALSAEELLARSKTTIATNLVSLYKSLGGGWEDQEPSPVDDL